MKSCNYCGAKNLYWQQLSRNKWVLLDESGDKHVCKVTKQKFTPINKDKRFIDDPVMRKALDKFRKQVKKI